MYFRARAFRLSVPRESATDPHQPPLASSFRRLGSLVVLLGATPVLLSTCALLFGKPAASSAAKMPAFANAIMLVAVCLQSVWALRRMSRLVPLGDSLERLLGGGVVAPNGDHPT